MLAKGTVKIFRNSGNGLGAQQTAAAATDRNDMPIIFKTVH